MAGTPVLGPVVFAGFEVPERISLGGRQSLAVHMLPGGGRVVDAMGPDEAPIRWSGTFSGPSAAERVRTLERLRRSGGALPLAWDGWLFTVLIQEFTAEVTSPWWIPYRIELCVLPETGFAPVDSIVALSGGSTGTITASASLDQQILSAGAALGSSELSDVVAASGQLAQLVAARGGNGS